jgi:hypothetical protein
MTTRPKSQDIPPLDADEFIAAYQSGATAAKNEFLEEIPVIGKRFIVTDVGLLALTNVFHDRFALAAVLHFGDDEQKYFSFMWRFLALIRLLRHPRMKRYIREISDARAIHSAIFEVAATQQLSDSATFNAELFFTEVERLARTENEPTDSRNPRG